MLTATRVIGRKALECSGIGSDVYTQRNFSSIIRSVSTILLLETNEYRLSQELKMSLGRNCLIYDYFPHTFPNYYVSKPTGPGVTWSRLYQPNSS